MQNSAQSCKHIAKPWCLIGLSLALLTGSLAAAVDTSLPAMAQGIQIGDVSQGRAIIWSRTDRPAQLMVEYAFNREFDHAQRLTGPYALENSDFTARLDLTGLPPGRDVYLKVWFKDLTTPHQQSQPITGRFHTLGANEDIRFVWGGDTAGQGWGINQNFGGMKIYTTMRQVEPQFFIHSGDNVYADAIIPAHKIAENGQDWTNLIAFGVDKVAETLDEFRGRYKYNLSDPNLRTFNAEVPQIWQWDDHEVVSNWSDTKDLSNDDRYQIKDIPLLVAHAATAFHEYAPLRPYDASAAQRIYRKIALSKLLDVFVLDMRSYRGPNSHNLQTAPGPDTAFLGAVQLAWLEQELQHSQAVWKVIAADMPLGLNIGDGVDATGQSRWEAIANGNDGPPAGRELEIAELLKFIKHHKISNIVWLTAETHSPAAHYYNPKLATFHDFSGFWEFVAGPLNAGAYCAQKPDATFGLQLKFNTPQLAGPDCKNPKDGFSPYSGLQFFGEVNINHKSRNMQIDLKNINGDKIMPGIVLFPVNTR
ncbi:alkaline phosphatase D family protein [Methylomonas paludis]|uniref:Alkaline phosphatase D family protein n=1 Tax=Methylomonas paludis TaxID=1173101 RepID=A0A975R9B2_9GAMM|nr:alkaline phosphatase D family protein [Methylomonas paludis]QWF71255.1 alkaline phosphatase D family protein [Methylomonas paludis]